MLEITLFGLWGEFGDTLAPPLALLDIITDKLIRLLIDGDGVDVNIALLNGDWVPVRVDEEKVVPLDEPEEQLETVCDRGGERENVSIADFFAE